MATKHAWDEDLLDYKSIGETFTKLVQSIDTGKVISIEAGFGCGKTFFRKEWAKQLNAEGEVVVELGVLQSDHSGEPVITLLGALAAAVPQNKAGASQHALEIVKNMGVASVRAAVRATFRTGADEIFEAMTEKAIDIMDDFDALDDLLKNVGDGMSKEASKIIASQMAAEKLRKEKLPKQLRALLDALTEGKKNKRVIIIVDELDRCHPDYALAFIEAMKVVFSQQGFVFCLMVNAEYLEEIASHRFGGADSDEPYLDKFVDIRLALASGGDNFRQAVKKLAMDLPNKNPFGDDDKFSTKHAADLAAKLAVGTGVSMRKVKRILWKVEIALRCYSDRPLDASLLVYLAFQQEVGDRVTPSALPRAFLTPGHATSKITSYHKMADRYNLLAGMQDEIQKKAPELLTLPQERFDKTQDSIRHETWFQCYTQLAPTYIPSHERVLRHVASVVVAS